MTALAAKEHENRSIVIAQVTPEHRADWFTLVKGYRQFYGSDSSDASLQITWNWILDEKRPLEALLLYVDDVPAGFAHYSEELNSQESTLLGRLDDFYVDPAFRGARLGTKLIDHLSSIGRERGWELLWWITDDNNYRAKTVYDRIAQKTGWSTYSIRFQDKWRQGS